MGEIAGLAAVSVKRLEWFWDHVTKTWDAKCAIGRYSVWEAAGHGFWFHDSMNAGKMSGPDADSAKAAAQADFQRRIFEALELSPNPSRQESAGREP